MSLLWIVHQIWFSLRFPLVLFDIVENGNTQIAPASLFLGFVYTHPCHFRRAISGEGLTQRTAPGPLNQSNDCECHISANLLRMTCLGIVLGTLGHCYESLLTLCCMELLLFYCCRLIY